MSRVYAQQKRPAAKAAEPSYRAAAVPTPSLVSGAGSSDLDSQMLAKYRQHFLDNQIPTAEAEADRIAASISGARTPEEVKTQLGEKMGADFSNVTFHTDRSAVDQADAMGARAYTSGSDVYFGSGGFDPGVAAHELVHTVQQGMVSSTMQTTSAPTGGVQMSTHFFKGIGRTISSLFGETKHKKKQRQQASDILLNIIYENPKYSETFQENKRKLEGDYARAQQMYSGSQQSWNGLTPELQKVFQHPDTAEQYMPLNPEHPSGDMISFPQVQKEYEHVADQYYGNPVRIEGLNGKSMLKNARALQALHQDFNGLDIRGVKKMSESMDPTSTEGIMAAYFNPREIRINDPYYKKGYGAFSAAANLGRKAAPRGVTTANHNYTFAHEAGHLVNFQLADKFNVGRDTDSRRIYGSTSTGQYNYGAVARAIIAESMAKEATEGKDKKLAKLLRKHGGFEKNADLNSKESLRKIADLLGDERGIAKSKMEAFSSGSPLLSALRKKGYTSIYGASQSTEMYAEAFGEHYKNQLKENEYSQKWYKWNKLRKLRNSRNKLSDRIVERSMELFHDADKREELYQNIGIDPNQERLEENARNRATQTAEAQETEAGNRFAEERRLAAERELAEERQRQEHEALAASEAPAASESSGPQPLTYGRSNKIYLAKYLTQKTGEKWTSKQITEEIFNRYIGEAEDFIREKRAANIKD